MARQINFKVNDELLKDIARELRRLSREWRLAGGDRPTVSEVIRQAIRNAYARKRGEK